MRSRITAIKAGAFWIFILTLVLASSSLSAGPESPLRLYPFPISELEKIVSDWLIDSGFEVSQTSSEIGQVRLKALKGNESWHLILRPYSPLASYVTAEYAINGQPDLVKLNELWSYLERYSRGLASGIKNIDQGIPAAVLYHSESVVCIKAKSGSTPLQFSGFIINKKGLIVSTAHSLKGIHEVLVIMNNSQELKGHLVKMDSYRDLILIDINRKVNSSISFTKARNLLGIGEKVYSIGCPLNHQGRVLSGIIDRLLKQENKLPLWQVDMETLPGSSGSPVFDAKGNLVGIVKGRFRGTDSVGFLIPLETVIEFLRDL